MMMRNTTRIRWGVPGPMLRFCGGLLLLSIITSLASAAIRPSFYLDYSVWKATDIVLATEGDSIDGRLRVIESWKGNLEAGAEVVLPELAAFADAESRRVHVWKGRQDVPEPYVRVVSGSKMVLFLVKPKPDDQMMRSDSKSPAWLPASNFEHGGVKVSVAWIERGEAYAFVQVFNPGPSVLTHVGIGVEMKAKVAAFSVIQANLDKAVEEKDALSAAQSLDAFSSQEFHYGAKGCIESLGKMGNAAVPTLRRLLNDRTFSYWHPDITSAMVAAGGVDVASDLTAVVEEGLEYWQERLPKLEKGWWNNAPDNERGRLRSRYGRLLAALRALRPLGYEPCREVVSSLRDLWRSDETLSDVGDSQMARACDAVLEGLSDGPSAP